MGKLENKAQKISRNQESLTRDISEEWLVCSVGDLTLARDFCHYWRWILNCVFLLSFISAVCGGWGDRGRGRGGVSGFVRPCLQPTQIIRLLSK